MTPTDEVLKWLLSGGGLGGIIYVLLKMIGSFSERTETHTNEINFILAELKDQIQLKNEAAKSLESRIRDLETTVSHLQSELLKAKLMYEKQLAERDFYIETLISQLPEVD